MAFDKCCCCLSKRTSVITCTLIMFIWYTYTVFDSLKSYFGTNDIILELAGISRGYLLAQLVMYAIAEITVFLLLIGILSNKLLLMKQFNIVYIIYLIVSIANDVFSSIKVNKLMNNITPEDLEKYNEALGNNSVLYSGNPDDIYNPKTSSVTKQDLSTLREAAGIMFTYMMLLLVIGIIVDIIYYITTRNYIKYVEKEEKELEDVKNMESAN